MEKKDYFSKQSKAYAAFRPAYPPELYDFIFQFISNRSDAWDCATGNGQVARYLAEHFDKVYASDISPQQVSNAFKANNIFYSIAPAERSGFPDRQFDLITVAQAIHWFDLLSFYREVKRVARPGAMLAVWGYAMLTVNEPVDRLYLDFYENKVGPYWDGARRLVENHYRDIPFPFEEINCPEFTIQVSWTLEQFTGYLTSWSATQKYTEANHDDPVKHLARQLKSHWREGEVKSVSFPVFMRLGRVGS